MSQERLIQLARQFPENGIKLLLQTPGNVHDLLALHGWPLLDRLSLDEMVIDPTAYVAGDFRHTASDLVLSVPMTSPGRAKRKKSLWLTILVEHQSEPDRLMVLRLLEYMVQIWRKQVREHVREHGSDASVTLSPILPVVFYTGRFRWERLGQLLDLMLDASDLAQHIPRFEPVFVNLPELKEEQLGRAGPFGQVLRVVQQRQAKQRAFAGLFRDVVRQLEPLAKGEHLRWLELLSYLQFLVYHERRATETEALVQVIRTSVRQDEDWEALDMARKTAAQVDRETWQLATRREMLLRQIQARFREVPPEIKSTVEGTQDIPLLDEWIVRFATAKTIADIGIPVPLSTSEKSQ